MLGGEKTCLTLRWNKWHVATVLLAMREERGHVEVRANMKLSEMWLSKEFEVRHAGLIKCIRKRKTGESGKCFISQLVFLNILFSLSCECEAVKFAFCVIICGLIKVSLGIFGIWLRRRATVVVLLYFRLVTFMGVVFVLVWEYEKLYVFYVLHD